MATPVNTQYQRELFQEIERHLPGTWFKQLHRQEGPLYPVLWAIAGSLAGAREAIESARAQAIPQLSEGFWLSLHLLSLGLTRRSAETDAQARTRYRFEFSPTRNTREGLLLALTTHSGLSSGQLRLETNFAGGAYGELSLVVDTTASWSTIQWWWLEDLFTRWIANGINSKASINATGLRTVALPPWDFYTRFPTSNEWLAPFWQRPAFINELRLIDTLRFLEERNNYALGVAYGLPAGSAWRLPNLTTANYILPVGITPIIQVPSALSDRPVSRNVLGFACLPNWNDHSLRMAEIWRNLGYTQQPGAAFVFLGENSTCDRLDVLNPVLPAPPFPTGTTNDLLGYGPWRLRLGNGTGSTITQTIATVDLSGQWWTDSDVLARSRTPINNNGDYYLLLEFLLPRTTGGLVVTQLELLLGYDQPQIGTSLGNWPLPATSAWQLPSAATCILQGGNNTSVLTPNQPSRSQIHYRTVNITIPPDVNAGFQLLVKWSEFLPTTVNFDLNLTNPNHSFFIQLI